MLHCKYGGRFEIDFISELWSIRYGWRQLWGTLGTCLYLNEHYESSINCVNSPLVDPVGEVTIMEYGSHLGYYESILISCLVGKHKQWHRRRQLRGKTEARSIL